MTVAPSEEAARQVVVCDINPEMLAVGRDRADKLFTGLQRDMVPQSAITNAVLITYNTIFRWVLLREMQRNFHFQIAVSIFTQLHLD